MKWFLAFLATIVVLGGFGYSGWLILQKEDELNQAHFTINSLNANLATAQSQLSSAQTGAADIRGQLDAEKSRSNTLQNELDAAKNAIANLEVKLADITALLSGTQNDIAAEINRLKSDILDAEAKLVSLRALNAELVSAHDATLAELRIVQDPRHFYSIEELRDWLARNNVNANPEYASLGLADKAFILQVKALRDGYLLPAAIDADEQHIYSWNIAIIGASIWVVIADTNETMFLANFEVPPAQHPLPLSR